MDIWERLPGRGGGGDVWERLAADLAKPAQAGAGLGVWAQVSVLPGGVWAEAKDETLERPLDEPGEDLWQAADDETLILDRGQVRSLWARAQDEVDQALLSGGEDAGLWEEVGDETLILSRPGAEIWRAPGIRDASRYRPVRALGWALKKLETAKGEPYWILKNLRQGAYLRLNERQVYLWKLMDGAHSVQDLAVACFIEFQVLSIEGLEGFLGQLHAKGFLVTGGTDVYRAAGMQLWRRTLNYWVRRLVGLLFSSEWSIKSVDRLYGAMYRLGGRLLFARPVVVFLWLVSLAGLPAFFYITQKGGLSVVEGAGGSLGWGLVGLLVAEVFAIFAHESAHALTTKHYGRTVRRGGVGLYFGMVTFFMDTTDIWMEPRGPRLAVTWAGPFSGFFLGGLASLALLFSPVTAAAGVAYQFASFCYGISTLNLNPLLKLDGYYLLMDWLETPMLRERAMRFVQRDLWRKLFRRERFASDERVFGAFGLLSLGYTVVIVFSVMRLAGGAVLRFLQGLLGSGLGLAATVILAVGMAAVLLWPYVRRFVASRRGKEAPA
jgi:putative peptide zinc metalloprotease protein